jgi:hypothetical protein
MRTVACLLGLILIFLTWGNLQASAKENEERLCTEGRVALPGALNFIGTDSHGYPVYFYSGYPNRSYVSTFGYLEDTTQPGRVSLTQPNGATLLGEPKSMTWRGVTVSFASCGGWFVRYLIEDQENLPLLITTRSLVPNNLPIAP